MVKVCHMTSAHGQEDIRIFLKECVSLAKAGYDTYQVSCGDTYDKFGVHLIGVGEKPKSRKDRMTKFAKKVYLAAKALDADIYHLHDPELLPYGLKLKKAGKKVIFDSHEDVPAQIMDKGWIPLPLRKLVSKLYKSYETYVAKRIDAVVGAVPRIVNNFEGRSKKAVVINNYPKLDDIEFHTKPFAEREPIVCYAGGVSELRGEKIMIEAMKDVDGILIIAGDHEIMELGGGVRYTGRLDRKGINDLYGSAIAGLCILQPAHNYYSQPPANKNKLTEFLELATKIPEYMAAGLPYICSDFPIWVKFTEESGAGICVDINDIKSISKAITTLFNDREKAQEMGRKGREYVLKNCNWANEEKSLLSLYKEVIGE